MGKRNKNMTEIINRSQVNHESEQERKSFFRRTRHPKDKTKVLKAEWIPDYFGLNRYGVRFPGEQKIYKPNQLVHGSSRDPYV